MKHPVYSDGQSFSHVWRRETNSTWARKLLVSDSREDCFSAFFSVKTMHTNEELASVHFVYGLTDVLNISSNCKTRMETGIVSQRSQWLEN